MWVKDRGRVEGGSRQCPTLCYFYSVNTSLVTDQSHDQNRLLDPFFEKKTTSEHLGMDSHHVGKRNLSTLGSYEPGKGVSHRPLGPSRVPFPDWGYKTFGPVFYWTDF